MIGVTVKKHSQQPKVTYKIPHYQCDFKLSIKNCLTIHYINVHVACKCECDTCSNQLLRENLTKFHV